MPEFLLAPLSGSSVLLQRHAAHVVLQMAAPAAPKIGVNNSIGFTFCFLFHLYFKLRETSVWRWAKWKWCKQMFEFHLWRSRRPLWKLMKGTLWSSRRPQAGAELEGRPAAWSFPLTGRSSGPILFLGPREQAECDGSGACQDKAMASQEAVVSLLTQVCANRTSHLQQTMNPLFHLTFIAHSLSLPSRHPAKPFSSFSWEGRGKTNILEERQSFWSPGFSPAKLWAERDLATPAQKPFGGICGPQPLPWLKRVDTSLGASWINSLDTRMLYHTLSSPLLCSW